MKQIKLFGSKADKTANGEATAKGKRKEARHFEPKKLVHIVMRSSKARGEFNFRKERNHETILKIIHEKAARHFVKIYEIVNVGNHLHIKARPFEKMNFSMFLRLTTSLIARKVTGARKGKAFGRFWDALCFTRILKTKFEEKLLRRYFYANRLEAQFGREVREIFLPGWPS